MRLYNKIRKIAGFTPLEKATDFNRWLFQFKADSGSMPPSVQTVRELHSLTGFTVLELIIVIAVIAILAGTSLLSFSSLTGTKLDSDTRKIVSDLCWARQTAVATRTNYITDFDLANERYTVYRDINGNGTPEANEEIQKRSLTADLASFTDFLGTPVAPERITFSFPSGTTQDRLVNLSYQARTRQVSVYGNTGYVKMQ